MRSALWWTIVLGLLALAGWSILVERLVDTPLLRLVFQPGLGLLLPLLTWAVLLE